MQPISAVIKKQTKPAPTTVSKDIFRHFNQILGPNGKKLQSTLYAPTTRFYPDLLVAPSYTSYVGVGHSILVENSNKLLAHPPPFFTQRDEERLNHILENQGLYRTNFERRSIKLLHDQKARHYKWPVKAILQDFGIDEHVILWWLFESVSDGALERSKIEALLSAAKLLPLKPSQLNLSSKVDEKSTPTRSDLKKVVLPKLKSDSTARTRAVASLVCVAFNHDRDKDDKFDAWEFFRRGAVMKTILQTERAPEGEILCRVCHV